MPPITPSLAHSFNNELAVSKIEALRQLRAALDCVMSVDAAFLREVRLITGQILRTPFLRTSTRAADAEPESAKPQVRNSTRAAGEPDRNAAAGPSRRARSTNPQGQDAGGDPSMSSTPSMSSISSRNEADASEPPAPAPQNASPADTPNLSPPRVAPGDPHLTSDIPHPTSHPGQSPAATHITAPRRLTRKERRAAARARAEQARAEARAAPNTSSIAHPTSDIARAPPLAA